ncbi:hypothetical protein CM240_3233 [Clostridium bornimense]|uniref:ABC transporter domain-containing protein n=1 Tax=Clostridium bornimense TaxID=1216932 RepID=W6SKF8_9CLOT|nr:ATP-binding cassette domain-containing protein [Clostridium bornimense]CDM70350.1 hypothetical protein CM240_3233 [Clostridium bornimense]
MDTLTIFSGKDKLGNKEEFDFVTFKKGNIYSIVGNTGSGKSRLIKDIEQFTNRDSVSNRKILIDNKEVAIEERHSKSIELVAHLSQNMRFVLDTSVKDFLNIHKECRKIPHIDINKIIETANTITAEPISLSQNLNSLSGGQTRALMIADIAHICDNPIILIDEIENAGIDKIAALNALLKEDKLIFIVTHDSHTALMADTRIIMKNGSIYKIIERSKEEENLLDNLNEMYQLQLNYQSLLREGEYLI